MEEEYQIVQDETPEREEWEPAVERADPLSDLRGEILSLKQQLQERDTSYEDDIKKSIADDVTSRLAPMMEMLNKPQAVARIVNSVGKGLSEDAKQHIEDYFNSKPYTASMVDEIRTHDVATLKMLRLAAEAVDSRSRQGKKAAPASESSTEREVAESVSDKDIDHEARALARQFGVSLEEAKKTLKETYKAYA